MYLRRLGLHVHEVDVMLHVTPSSFVEDVGEDIYLQGSGQLSNPVGGEMKSTGMYVVSVQQAKLTYTKPPSIAAEALAPSEDNPVMDVVAHDARFLWDERTRDVVFNVLDMYDQYRVLKRHFRGLHVGRSMAMGDNGVDTPGFPPSPQQPFADTDVGFF